MTDPDDVPEWWRENARLKAEMGLPAYEPPRFADGTYAFEVVERIEAEHDCRVRFMGVDTRYEDDWEVRVGGETAFEIGRRRDDSGNTIYDATAEAFQASLREFLEERDRGRD